MLLKLILIFVVFCVVRIYGLKECDDCVNVEACSEAMALLPDVNNTETLNKFHNAICGNQKVCCSDFMIPNEDPNEDPNEGNVESHRNLALLPDKCGVLLIDGRIIGGDIADMYEYPWMALLIFRVRGQSSGNPLFKCGGTIINSRYILTAAHCFDNPREILSRVRVGEYNIKTAEDCDSESCESHLQDLKVKKIIIHENYDKTTTANDIALLRTKTPIDFKPRNVRPICLPISEELRYKDLGGKIVTIAGWGVFINKVTLNSNVLLKVEVPIWNEAECRNSIGDSKFENLKIICAGETGKDSCKGDSGGPLMGEEYHSYRYRMVQFGVVSNGPRSCGSDEPGIYTDVTKYIYWILENLEA